MKDNPVALAYSYKQYESFSQLISAASLYGIEMVCRPECVVFVYIIFSSKAKNFTENTY